jgi:NADPH:quinone reductase-like Zn-dependent oxidoreductase
MRLGEGLRGPKFEAVGSDLAGTIVEVGPQADTGTGTGASVEHLGQPIVGQRVVAAGQGAFGAYAVAKNDGIAVLPDAVSFEQACAIPVAGLTALQAVQKAEVSGRSVLVNGAAGGVGHLAVQVARIYGATRVVGVCSGRNVELVAGLGVDEVIDYQTQDFTDQTFDVILDCVGNRSPGELIGALSPGGRVIGIGMTNKTGLLAPIPAMVAALARFGISNRSYSPMLAKVQAKDLAELVGYLADGRLQVVTDTTYPIDRIGEAFAHLATGRARGKILIAP